MLSVRAFLSSIYYGKEKDVRVIRLRFFSRPAKGIDKIVWSVRFRRARRTIVRRAAKSGAEKAKTLFHLLKESARIPTAFRKSDYTKAVIKKLVFAFSVRTILSDRRCDFFRKIPTLAECGS